MVTILAHDPSMNDPSSEIERSYISDQAYLQALQPGVLAKILWDLPTCRNLFDSCVGMSAFVSLRSSLFVRLHEEDGR